MAIREIPIDAIITDEEIQPRDLNWEVVNEYAEAMEHGQEFPPIRVCHEKGLDGDLYWLWCGFHRTHAATAAGLGKIKAEVTKGDKDQARWLALSTNAEHGLRRTNEEKREAVARALAMKPEASDRAIAEHCRVSHPLVAVVRKERSGKASGKTTTATDDQAGPGPQPATEPAEAIEPKEACTICGKRRPAPGNVACQKCIDEMQDEEDGGEEAADPEDNGDGEAEHPMIGGVRDAIRRLQEDVLDSAVGTVAERKAAAKRLDQAIGLVESIAEFV